MYAQDRQILKSAAGGRLDNCICTCNSRPGRHKARQVWADFYMCAMEKLHIFGRIDLDFRAWWFSRIAVNWTNVQNFTENMMSIFAH